MLTLTASEMVSSPHQLSKDAQYAFTLGRLFKWNGNFWEQIDNKLRCQLCGRFISYENGYIDMTGRILCKSHSILFIKERLSR